MNCVAEDKVLGWSHFESICKQRLFSPRFVHGKVENIVEKVEKDYHQHFCLFPQSCQKFPVLQNCGTIRLFGEEWNKRLPVYFRLSWQLIRHKILALSTLEAFVHCNFSVVQMNLIFFDRVENIVGKGEKDAYLAFSHFPAVLFKGGFSRAIIQ